MPRKTPPHKDVEQGSTPSADSPLTPGTWTLSKEGTGTSPRGSYPERTPSAPPPEPVFVLKCGNSYARVHPERIIYIKAQGNYVEVHLADQRMVLRSSLAEVLKALPAGIMVRVNRAQAVNILLLDHVGTSEVRAGELTFSLSSRYRTDVVGQLKVLADR